MNGNDKVFIFLYACAMAILLTGCGGGFGTVTPLNNNNNPPTQQDRVTLTGTVKNEATNLPLQNALIIFGGNRTTTDANGAFALSNVSVSRRQSVLFSPSVKAARRLQATQTIQVALSVSLHQFESFFNDTFSIQTGGTASVDVKLVAAPGSGTFTGLVRENGTVKVVGDALMTIGAMKGRTDKEGRFQISGALPAPQMLRVEASGFTPTVLSVNVAPEEIKELPPIDMFKTGDLIPVSGKVLDENREGIVGATVRIGNRTAQTTAGGAFSFNAPAGNQPLVVNAAGFESLAQNIEVFGGLPPLELVLAFANVEPPTTPFTVRGTILDSGGNPVSGARVTALEQPGNVARDIVVTRNDGRYRLFIAPGLYLIRVEKSGFQTAERNVTVPTGGQVVDNFNVTLVSGSSPSRVLRSSSGRKRLE
jgi:hypothetical protein